MCDDYIAFKAQIAKPFGVIPFTSLTTYVGAPPVNDTCTEVNHSSSLEIDQDIRKYICEELSYSAMLGPFDKKPI